MIRGAAAAAGGGAPPAAATVKVSAWATLLPWVSLTEKVAE